MSFRIRTSSPALQRELEKRVAELEGQLGNESDYEIEAEVLPREQAIARAEELARETAAESIFIAAGTLQAEACTAEDPPSSPEPSPSAIRTESTGDGACATPIMPIECTLTSVPEAQPAKFDFQGLQASITEKSSRARESFAIGAAKTGLFLKRAGVFSAQVIGRAAKWSAERGTEARERAAEWNARRLERRAAESRARAERQRAAHRQAELAAAAARAMDQHRGRETAQREPRRVTQKPTVATNPAPQQRDSWPIWRNAFAAAACLVAVGIFLIAGGKQTKASPSVTSEEKPAVIAPAPVAPAKTITPAAKPVAAKAQQKPATPSARKHNARPAVDEEDAQEVTVRHYGTNLPSAPAKKDPKGVVQISDME